MAPTFGASAAASGLTYSTPAIWVIASWTVKMPPRCLIAFRLPPAGEMFRMPVDPAEARSLGAMPLRYFSHDSDASADPKCKRLIRSEGVAGYGRWWLLCELLAGTEGHSLPIETADDLENLACSLEFDTAEDAAGFVRRLDAIGLVVIEDGRISSPRMTRTADWFGSQRARGRAGGRARKNKVA